MKRKNETQNDGCDCEHCPNRNDKDFPNAEEQNAGRMDSTCDRQYSTEKQTVDNGPLLDSLRGRVRRKNGNVKLTRTTGSAARVRVLRTMFKVGS